MHLINTDFGRVVLAKSALLLALARSVRSTGSSPFATRAPRAAASAGVGGTEIVIAVVILGLSGLLVNLSPPATADRAPAPRRSRSSQPATTTGRASGRASS